MSYYQTKIAQITQRIDKRDLAAIECAMREVFGTLDGLTPKGFADGAKMAWRMVQIEPVYYELAEMEGLVSS